MISSQEKQMLIDFGFKDNADLQQSLKTSPIKRYRTYDFKWRLKLMSKYKNVHSTIKNDIIKFNIQYEDYVLKNQTGSLKNWPEKAKNQSEYLFDRLTHPWQLIKHGKLLFSVKSPNNTLWFRAIDLAELFKALDICYKESKKSGAKTKPWHLKMEAKECASSFNRKVKKGTLWVTDDYKIALLICINIITTWNSRNGDWKPWSYLGSWGRRAHNNFKHELKYGYPVTKGNTWLSRIAYEIAASSMNSQKPLRRDVKFHDVANFVFREGNKGMKQAAFIIGTAFAVGGSRAGKIIGSFCDQHNIPKNRLKK